MAKRIYESPSNTEKAKFLRCDKKDGESKFQINWLSEIDANISI